MCILYNMRVYMYIYIHTHTYIHMYIQCLQLGAPLARVPHALHLGRRPSSLVVCVFRICIYIYIYIYIYICIMCV